MPEIPDLEGYRAYFNKRLLGIRLTGAQILIPIVVRASREEFATLAGKSFGEVQRVGKYLLFPFEGGPHLVVHPMLTGRFQYCEPKERKRAKTAFVLSLENDMELRYFDDRLMGKVYLVAPTGGQAREEALAAKVSRPVGAPPSEPTGVPRLVGVPRWSEMGPDPMDEMLTEEGFRQRLKAYRGQIKNVLTTEQFVRGIGNAYSDEILFEAGIHPYRKRTELSTEAESRLYRATRSVLEWATPIVAERMEKEGLPADHYRDHLRVHRRGGQPCPKCGSAITEITANQRITSFCRHCQR